MGEGGDGLIQAVDETRELWDVDRKSTSKERSSRCELIRCI